MCAVRTFVPIVTVTPPSSGIPSGQEGYRGEIEMDSSFNHRHAQVHSADLHHRAELHRQVVSARAERRSARRPRPSLLAPPTLAERAQLALARLRHKPAPRAVNPG